MKKINLKLLATILAILAVPIVAFTLYAHISGKSSVFADFSDGSILLLLCIAAMLGGFLWLLLAPERSAGKWNPQQLVVGALCLALSFVLSYIKLFEMPQGGSVTPASMLPIVLFSYIYGARKGLILGLAYGLLNMIQGAYVVHWAQFILDYIFAFAVLGLGGVCKKHIVCSIGIAAAGRLFFSVLSGTIFFAEYAGEQNALLYSIIYNASYLIPETLICIVITLIPAVNRMIEQLKRQYR